MLLPQLGLKLVVVADDAVVDDGDAATVVEVRVRVDVRLVAVGGPARVPDRHVVVVARRPLHAHPLDAVAAVPVRARELRAHPNRFVLVVARDRDDTAGVVAATLQDLEPLNADRTRLWSIA